MGGLSARREVNNGQLQVEPRLTVLTAVPGEWGCGDWVERLAKPGCWSEPPLRNKLPTL
jgi:hypothetical protein